jgi:serine/threonine protein kinase
MGTVYLGRAADGRVVAVKAIRPEYADQEEFRARFRSEVNRVLQVPAFCTAAVLDADPDHETPYLIVDYVDGPSLQEVIRERGPMAPGDLHGVAVGVAAALTAIHGAGVIHRDLKPTNVLFSLGLPKVIDFGIAKALEPTSRHTRTDHVMGTVAYMAPERLDPTLGDTTPAADIFAWASVVTYAGTGRTPFGGDTPMATAARILAVPPDVSGLPDSLADLVRQALSKDPRQRPTATDLLQQLLAAGPKTALPLARAVRNDPRLPRALSDLLPSTDPSPPGEPRVPGVSRSLGGPGSRGERHPLSDLLPPAQPRGADVSRSLGGPGSQGEPHPLSDLLPPARPRHADVSRSLGGPGSSAEPHPLIGISQQGGERAAGVSRSFGGSGSQGERHPLSDLLPPSGERAAGGSRSVSDLPSVAESFGRELVPPSDSSKRFDSRQLRGELVTTERKRGGATTRRMLYTLAALLGLTLVGAGVAYARTMGDVRPLASPSQATATATSAEALVAKGPSFFDPLSGPGRFHASSEETGSCAFDGKNLRARSAAGSTYQCRGPADTFSGTQTVTVQLTLQSAGSCAMVWFRHRDLHGYELTACADSLELVSAGDALPESIGRVPSTVLEPGTRHQVAIEVADDHATVSIDGALALQAALNDSTLSSGGIALGVTGSSGAATVLFGNLDVR